MSMFVRDFKYVAGKNDAEYIKLLEDALDRQRKITGKAISRIRELTKSAAPVTNADRIRSMTDEELAEFMRSVCDTWYIDANQNWLSWLKSPAEKDGDGDDV